MKFTQQRKIVIRIWREQQDRICFDVQDSDIGITEEEQKKIFAMFYQVKGQHGCKPATSTGIVVVVSKRLAQAMGGDITVKSEFSQGSCFSYPSWRWK